MLRPTGKQFSANERLSYHHVYDNHNNNNNNNNDKTMSTARAPYCVFIIGCCSKA